MPNNVTPEQRAFYAMRDRCTNPNCPVFEHYGGRGIGIDPRWSTRSRFLEDMGPRPSPKHSLHRVDNDVDYGPDNCVWADRETQSKHRRNTVWMTFGGETLTQTDWARRTGLSLSTIVRRIGLGWTVEDTLTKPPDASAGWFKTK